MFSDFIFVIFFSLVDRYFEPPTEWIACSLESRELLSFCLKRLKGLNEVKLVDASFVWTEPHSKRIKVKILLFSVISFHQLTLSS